MGRWHCHRGPGRKPGRAHHRSNFGNTKELADDRRPLIIGAPRRQAAETMTSELARHLPTPSPLQLSAEQKLLVGERLAKLLKSRIAYHHSGLSYGARAGVIEPLAKAGQ